MKEDRTIPSGVDWLDAATYGAGWLVMRLVTLNQYPNWRSPRASIVKAVGAVTLLGVWSAIVAYNWWIR